MENNTVRIHHPSIEKFLSPTLPYPTLPYPVTVEIPQSSEPKPKPKSTPHGGPEHPPPPPHKTFHPLICHANHRENSGPDSIKVLVEWRGGAGGRNNPSPKLARSEKKGASHYFSFLWVCTDPHFQSFQNKKTQTFFYHPRAPIQNLDLESILPPKFLPPACPPKIARCSPLFLFEVFAHPRMLRVRPPVRSAPSSCSLLESSISYITHS